MARPVIIRPEAEEDLREAKKWYEQQRHRLGDEIIQCVEDVFESLVPTPEMHAKVYKDVRRAVVRRFPYVVYYRVDANQITVLAVVHGRRHPQHWRSRA